MEKRLLQEIIKSLTHVRCYSLKDILQDLLDERISADEAEKFLIEFNTDFNVSIDIDPSTLEVTRYREFMKIGGTDVDISKIYNIAKSDHYSFTKNKMLYGIVINKASNDFNPTNNQTFYFDSGKERDRVHLLIKDVMCVYGNVKFN